MDEITGKVVTAKAQHDSGDYFPGVMTAVVTDIVDPDGQGRVKIKLPERAGPPHGAGASLELWARLATLMAGNNRGTWFVPDVGDGVLVAFSQGDPSHPFVLGGLWNGSALPPQAMDGAGKNFKKVIRSRNGVQITLDDQDGQESLRLETPAGQRIELRDGPESVMITDADGNSIKLDATGITVQASAKVTINASQVLVSAGTVHVDVGMSTFSGAIRCDTIIATNVVGTNYTPGAGNIW